MTFSTRHLPFAAALALSLSAALGAQTDRRTLSGDRVAVYNLAGRLRVQPVGGSQVTVDITRGGRDASRLQIAAGDVRGVNSLRVVYPSDRIVYPEMNSRSRTQIRVNSDGTFNDNGDRRWGDRDQVEIRGSGSGLEAYADLVVGVPKGQRITVNLGVGEAFVTNVDGDIRVDVSSARVTTEHTRGRLDLDTGSGSVSVTDAQGDVSLDVGSGGVTVNGVRGDRLLVDAGSGSMRGGDIDVKTLDVDVGSGGITLDRIRAPDVKVDAGSGTVEMSFAAAVDNITVDAGSGGVTLRLPAGQGGEVDIETGSGGIQSDFAVTTTRLERRHLRGRIGNGNARIRIESGSGSVRLLKY